jgi:ABC-2 type transport system ATP-binding protein
VDGVTFTVRRGEILGFLGPNGAGKTTTVSIVSGLLSPDAGEVRIGGNPVSRDDDPCKGRVGLVPQDIALHETLSALHNLEIFAGLQGLSGARRKSACDEALAFVGLADRARDRVSKFSGGMKRRLNLAAGLLHDPELLLLDEPTVGVDPQSRNFIFENLEALRARGKAILYTTHYMEEVERLCERVVIIDQGKVLADDRVQALRDRAAGAARLEIDLAAPAPEGLASALTALPEVREATATGQHVSATVSALGAGAAAILSLLDAQGLVVDSVQTDRPTLETVFLSLTGRRLRDA